MNPLSEKPVQLSYIHYPTPTTTPPFLFIHGAESSKETWQPVMTKLKGKYDMYAVDLRGHGESSLGDGEFSLKAVVHDLYQFVKDHHLSKVSLIAHSMGSRVAVCFAAAYPEYVQSLLIEDMEMTPREPQVVEASKLSDWKCFKQFHETLQDAELELERYGYSKKKIESFKSQGKIKKISDRFFIGLNPYVNYLAKNGISASDKSLEAFKILNTVDFPIKLLIAESDSSVTESGKQAMMEYVPKMSVSVVPSSMHGIHKTNTPFFIDQMVELSDRPC